MIGPRGIGSAMSVCGGDELPSKPRKGGDKKPSFAEFSCQDLTFMRSKSFLANLWIVVVGWSAVGGYLDGSSELP